MAAHHRPPGRPAPARVVAGPLVLLIAAVGLSPPAALAASFLDVPGYVGGGFQYGWVASGNPSIAGARGPGIGVVFGRRLRDRYPLYFDLRFGGVFVDVGPTPDIAYPADRADYAVMALGGLWDFRSPGGSGWGPWLSLHGTYHNFNWRTYPYNIEGVGFSPGAGMNLRVPHVGLLQIGLIGHYFSASSNHEAGADGQSLLLSMNYLYEFGPRERP